MNNYFTHDSNARNADNILALRMRLGAEGYGIYFMILERLREEPDYTSVKDYNMLAFDFRVGSDKVKSVVEDFGLFHFTENGERFYSDSFLRRMQVKDEMSKKAKASATYKWGESNAMKRSERLSLARAKATHSEEEWEELKTFFGHCVLCGKSAEEVKLVKDHIIPIYQGGSDGIDNLQPLCQSCNARKGPDSTDHRITYCLQKGLEMPAKWLRNACETPAKCLRNACETPAIKGKKSKENSTSNEVEKKKPAASAATTEERKELFRKSLVPFVDQYGREMIREFFDYWTEKTRSGAKMRYELERTWETPRRLATWSRRKEEKSCAKREGNDNYGLRKDAETIGRTERRSTTL